jgi:hypothetical protein
MNIMALLIIENGMFLLTLLVCLYATIACLKFQKTVPGADLMAIGFMLYGIYALLAIVAPGFNGSFFEDFIFVAKLQRGTEMYFVALALRLGLILIVAGMFRVGRGLKA